MGKVELTKSEAESMDQRLKLISQKEMELKIFQNEAGSFLRGITQKYKLEGRWVYQGGCLSRIKDDGTEVTNS